MLAHDRTGSGRPLLLLHGTNSSRAIWSPLIADLAVARDVIAVDLPAHGESPPTSMTPPAWAPEVAALLDALDVERPAVVGHSAGGWTALELAKLGRAGSVLALARAAAAPACGRSRPGPRRARRRRRGERPHRRRVEPLPRPLRPDPRPALPRRRRDRGRRAGQGRLGRQRTTSPVRRTSRHTDQLPAHAVVETWARCGHMVMWDRRDDLVREALALP
jgi:pimeloyl-ACP methyl ester carboxylesterase